ncbi:response regulator transcription factor [Paenibacillus oryzisoli]|uniref:response regulator n=1 Tax=Paenibacillus oryzisoli TaxID=1850517 RepID=UPI003D280EF5
MYRVVVVDDREIVRAGLRMLLESCGSYEVAGEAANGEEALSQVVKLAPDLLLTDLKMPGIPIIEGARVLKALFPQLKIMIITAFDESEDIYRALNAGVDGYLMKDTSPETILSAIHAVMNGASMFLARERP